MGTNIATYGAVSRKDTFSYRPEDLVLVTDKSHPLYDERVHKEPKKSLISSILKHGVIVPILVRRNGFVGEKPIIEVVDGRQRVKASIEANKQLVETGQEPMLIQACYRVSDDSEAEDCMIVTNEHRVQDDVVTKAEKLRRYLDRGHSEDDAKLAFCLKAQELPKLLKVLEMGAELKEALQAKRVTCSIAVRLSELPRQQQPEALQQVLEGGAGRGRGRKAAAVAERATGKDPSAHPRTAKTMLQVVENVNECLAMSDYRKGVLDALNWALGRKEPVWAKPEKKQRKPREKRN